MKRPKVQREWIPAWEMPADPVKAVFWFMHWFLKIVVRFFWLPLAAITILEIYLNWLAGGVWNALLAGLITLVIGGLVLLVLRGVLIVANAVAGVSRVVSGMQEERTMPPPVMRRGRENEGRVVEGTISEINEERSKRK